MSEKETRIQIRENLSWEEKRMAIQTALILGFQSESAEFPIAAIDGKIAVPSTVEELSSLLNKMEIIQEIPDGYVDATASAKPIPEFDWRKTKGLESLFAIGKFLKDKNMDLLPDDLDFQFVLPDDASVSMLIAACNLAFRFGMETTKCSGWIATSSYEKGNAIIFRENTQNKIYIEETATGTIVNVEGNGQELEQLMSSFCEEFPQLSTFETWARKLQEMIDGFAMKNVDGQLAYLDANYTDKKIEVYANPEIENRILEIEKRYPKTDIKSYKGMKEIYVKEYDISWEVDKFNDILEKSVYPQISADDVVEIHAALSEEEPLRVKLTNQITATLKENEAVIDDVTIICSYKQGFSWIEEKMLPLAKKYSNLKKVKIAFKPFLPEGVTDWQDENGATPSYNNLGGDPDKWYDLPIRYLQELYPIEDVLVKGLDLSREQIEFIVYEGSEDITYEFIIEDETDANLSLGTYKARCAERPYLDQYAHMGKVHPSTGYLQVKVNGDTILEERIESDVEKIWDIYQSEVLADCRTFIDEKSQGSFKIEDQPFFARLKLEVVASEPDYRLASREDLFSTLDGLHEDMYFAGADYFKNYGMEKAGAMFEEPGLILPVIEKGEGKPFFKVTLYDQEKSEPEIWVDGNKIQIPVRDGIDLYMKELIYEDEGWHVKLVLEGVAGEVAKSYLKLLQEQVISPQVGFGECQKLTLICKDGEHTATIKSEEPQNEVLDIQDIDLLENQLIGYDEYIKIIEQLKKVSGIAVYRTAISYAGREIYAIELLPTAKGYVSRTKRLTNYPSEIINGRHHANEVSATNAAFILLKELLTNKKFENLADKLNLVIVPMENVDGSAIHYELQKKNPYWKLHVARFNAVGKEFYYEHFKADTKHTEAMGLTRLFETFLPDIIIDNHGVPTHEWEQQFAGYTSPSYKGFWLPRSLLYGYFWMVNNDEYKSNYDVNKKMEDVVAKAVAKVPEIRKLNIEWAGQFEKYAHKWMPKLFPANYYKEMINYWIPFEADQAHRYPSIRFPWITTVAYTSEVADETAQGDYLNLCARAHVTHDVAIINMLIDAKCIYENRAVLTANTMEICHTRRRPIIV